MERLKFTWHTPNIKIDFDSDGDEIPEHLRKAIGPFTWALFTCVEPLIDEIKVSISEDE